MNTVSQNGTDGRVYGGDCDLIHVADGKRADAGRSVAHYLDGMMREYAYRSGTRTSAQADTQALCPGCYMIVGFNALVTLAKENGQSMRELGLTMAQAFQALAECTDESGDACMEEINVILDPED